MPGYNTSILPVSSRLQAIKKTFSYTAHAREDYGAHKKLVWFAGLNMTWEEKKGGVGGWCPPHIVSKTKFLFQKVSLIYYICYLYSIFMYLVYEKY
jgi:hypothetical protein